MKTLILTLVLCASSFSFANEINDLFTPLQPPPYRPRPPHRDLFCRAYDRGFEEHYGGHRSCQECLGQHDSCTEICRALSTRHYCQVRGWNRRYETGYRFTGTGDNRREALERANFLCYRAGYRYCRLEQCWQSDRNDIVSRKDCRHRRHDDYDEGRGRH